MFAYLYTIRGWDHIVCMLGCIYALISFVLVCGYLWNTTSQNFQTKIRFLELTKVLTHIVGEVFSEV